MFDLILSGLQAYNQIGMLFGAAICLGLGGLLLGNSLYWRLTAMRVFGTTVGVVAKDGMYAAVYRYTAPDGRSVEAKSDIATGWIGGYETGRVVPLLIARHDPTEARKAGSILLDIAGVVCLIPGVLFAYIALTAFPLTMMTWVVGGALVAYVGARAYRAFQSGATFSLADWRRRLRLGTPAQVDLRDVKTAEEIRGSADFQRSQVNQLAQNKFARPLVALFAIGLIGIGAYLGVRLAHLEMTGERAQGEVIRLQEEYSSDDDGGGYVYYPIVRFRTATGDTIEFKDSVGSDPPLVRVGDRVTVLFAPDSPGRDVTIDRGLFWNGLMPALLLLFGGGLARLWLFMRRSATPAAVKVDSGKVNAAVPGRAPSA